MQLFGLVNTLLSNDPETSKRDLLIGSVCACVSVTLPALTLTLTPTLTLTVILLQEVLCDATEPRGRRRGMGVGLRHAAPAHPRSS
jgi:hypothetical protein